MAEFSNYLENAFPDIYDDDDGKMEKLSNFYILFIYISCNILKNLF